MNKLRNVILVLILNIVLILICINIPTYAYTGEITTETLRIRKEPSTDASVLGLVTTGDEVEILAEEGDWIKVKFGDITGYVSSQYVKKSTVSSTNTTNSSNSTKNTTSENTTNTNVNETVENTIVNEPEKNKDVDKEDLLGEKTIAEKAKVYLTPVIFSSQISTIESGEKVEVISVTNGWVYIQNNKHSGWIRTDKLSNNNNTDTNSNETTNTETTDVEPQEETIQTSKKYINDSVVNMRKEPTTSSDVVTKLSLNTQVEVIAQSGDWYKVKYNGEEGYILGTLLSDNKKEVVQVTDRSLEELRAAGNYNSTSEEVIAFGKQYLGCPYVYGGAGSSSFDCSGFTMYVYKQFGINLPHTATGQSKLGVYVDRADLQLGDLIIFNDAANAGIGHVGIYIGDGNFIHASSGAGKVVITALSSDYYARRYVTARRVL